MALIRKKVQEFETINGLWSMPELQSQNKEKQENEDDETTATTSKKEPTGNLKNFKKLSEWYHF